MRNLYTHEQAIENIFTGFFEIEKVAQFSKSLLLWGVGIPIKMVRRDYTDWRFE